MKALFPPSTPSTSLSTAPPPKQTNNHERPGINNNLSLIPLSIDGLNSPIKTLRLTEWMRKQNSAFSCNQKAHHNIKDKQYLTVKGWKSISQANGPKKQAAVPILMSIKNELQTKTNQKRWGREPQNQQRKKSQRTFQFLTSMPQT